MGKRSNFQDNINKDRIKNNNNTLRIVLEVFEIVVKEEALRDDTIDKLYQMRSSREEYDDLYEKVTDEIEKKCKIKESLTKVRKEQLKCILKTFNNIDENTLTQKYLEIRKKYTDSCEQAFWDRCLY